MYTEQEIEVIATERGLTIDHHTGVYLDDSGNEYRHTDGQILRAEGDIFKCADCGDKYHDSFSATHDRSLCRWCSEEEV